MGANQKNRKKIDKKYVYFSRLKRKLMKHVWFVRLGLIGIGLVILLLISNGLGKVSNSLGISDSFSFAKNFVFAPRPSINSIDGRTNILILGKGGEGHETPDLTDTIIFASISHDKEGLVMVSLPRDIWVPEIRAKINSAYFWGNESKEGGGLILAKSIVEEIVGQPIHYGVVIDFSGFKDIVDVLGGIEVQVENSFVDEKFPILGKEDDRCGGDRELKCRYETIEFVAGVQEMDGETALKFVRSRNSTGDEGTDLARAARQQKVFSAIKNEILSLGSFSPKKIIGLTKTAREVVETDIENNASAVLARRFMEAGAGFQTQVLPEELLFNPPISPRYDNLYVFLPESGTWVDVQEWIENLY